MKHNLISTVMALAMLLALGGCGKTGGVDGTMNTNPGNTAGVNDTASPNPANTAGVNNTANPNPAGTDTLPNNAGGTVNSRTNNTAGTGSYYAGRNGSVWDDSGMIGSAGRMVRDAAHDVENAVRDVA